jgi:hypothetical protein
MHPASEKLAKFLHLGIVESSAPVLFRAGSAESMSKADRKELLKQVRAQIATGEGDPIELEVEAVTYIQRSTPNRNAIRFKDAKSVLNKIAKSGKGNPVLRDHDQHSVMSRGGTVLTSKSEVVGDETHFKQRLSLVKPWLVEGVLDGTVDRFSIGWFPTGPITYSHNGEEVAGWPEYWPGDELEDGSIVEWVYSSADLIEVSAVNVPAVTGTHIEGIRSALSVETGPSNQPKPGKEETMSKRFLQTLGLNESASDETIAGAIEEIKTKSQLLSTELAAVKTQLEAANAIAEKATKDAAERAALKLEGDISALYSEGKLAFSHGASGASPDPMEEHLRKLHAVGGQEMFEQFSSSMKAVAAPVGKLQTEEPAPPTDATQYDSNRRTRLRSSGMTPERHAELAARVAQQNGTV